MRRIADKGSALVKIDGPYGGSSSLTGPHCQVAVIFAGGIGVSSSCMTAEPASSASGQDALAPVPGWADVKVADDMSLHLLCLVWVAHKDS